MSVLGAVRVDAYDSTGKRLVFTGNEAAATVVFPATERHRRPRRRADRRRCCRDTRRYHTHRTDRQHGRQSVLRRTQRPSGASILRFLLFASIQYYVGHIVLQRLSAGRTSNHAIVRNNITYMITI